MIAVVAAIHVITLAIALGGRIIFIPILRKTRRTGLNERLDELHEVLTLARYADIGLILTLLTGILLYFASGYTLSGAPWSFKLKLVALLLLFLDIAAFYVAKARITQHYDIQMVPALQRFNSLAVALMSATVMFATLT